MSAYRLIIEVLQKAKPRTMTSREIGNTGIPFDMPVINMALHDMAANGDGPVERGRPDTNTPFTYGIRDGFDAHAWLEDKEARARGGKVVPKPAAPALVAPNPAVRVVHQMEARKPAAVATPIVAPSKPAAAALLTPAAVPEQRKTVAEQLAAQTVTASTKPLGVNIDSIHRKTAEATVRLVEKRDPQAAGADAQSPRAHTFQLPIPGKTSAFVTLPADITGDDWGMLKTILDVYVARLREQRAGAST
jgi:hypothetical protein